VPAPGEIAGAFPVPGEQPAIQGARRLFRELHGADYNDGMPEQNGPRDAAGRPPAAPAVSVTRHSRNYREYRYVYPVLSRRARGISIGVNLNPDTVCNFDCIYCQVDRTTPPAVREVDEQRLGEELTAILADARGGALYDRPEFRAVPETLRVVRDITFAGDGEPPSYPNFKG